MSLLENQTAPKARISIYMMRRFLFFWCTQILQVAASTAGSEIFYQSEETYENVIHGTGYVTIALFLDAQKCDEHQSCDKARKQWQKIMRQQRGNATVNILWIGIYDFFFQDYTQYH